MIEITKGDILKADTDALVNTVNCVGFSGRGIALQFRKAFPENYKTYAMACRRGEVEPGRMFVFETGHLTSPRYIINFPTKRHWRGKSRLEDIESGLRALIKDVRRLRIRSIAIPPLGSGLGGLDWAVVRPKIEAALASLDVRVMLFEPSGSPDSRPMASSAQVPKMSAGSAAVICLMHRYLAGLMDPFVSLLEIHKLLYFMQEAGEPLRLRYTKAPYGPYAENLRHVLMHIEGHFISGYTDGTDSPTTQLELVPGAVADATRFLDDHSDTHSRFDRVVDLVQGFETPFGLELLSSVHWVVTRDGATTPEKAIAKTYAWNDRKQRFSRDQIRIAWEALHKKDWLPTEH